SVERVIGPDSTILLDYMLDRMTRMMENLVVYPQNMMANLEKSRGMIYSEGILLKLVQKGLTREEAYALVQKAAFQVMDGKRDFMAVLLKDREILRHMKPAEIRRCFDLRHALRHVDEIFARVFGRQKAPKS
ncbi:MAG: adenylosuccinate lyase, partial [Syntrophaceae bacterium]|nr:adenylosuccinate lyase [Syntrophaceae bacterium]